MALPLSNVTLAGEMRVESRRTSWEGHLAATDEIEMRRCEEGGGDGAGDGPSAIEQGGLNRQPSLIKAARRAVDHRQIV